MKELLALVLGAVVLASNGALAEDAHRCVNGTHWDPKKMECVATTRQQ
jgi:hypothetical protein